MTESKPTHKQKYCMGNLIVSNLIVSKTATSHSEVLEQLNTLCDQRDPFIQDLILGIEFCRDVKPFIFNCVINNKNEVVEIDHEFLMHPNAYRNQCFKISRDFVRMENIKISGDYMGCFFLEKHPEIEKEFFKYMEEQFIKYKQLKRLKE